MFFFLNSEKNNYIILANSLSNSGLNIHMRTNIISKEDNTDICLNEFFYKQYSNKYKHRILLSQHVSSTGSNITITPCCFVTQNNIKNNIKFIHDVSNTNRKILFIYNQDHEDNSYNYFIDNIGKEAVHANNPVFYHLNYYFNKIINSKDYFNIKIKDFIHKDNEFINPRIHFDTSRFKISNISTTRNTSSNTTNATTNYNSFDFVSLFIDNKTDPSPINSYADISINKLNKDLSYSLYSNIYSYNKLFPDFYNVTTYTFSIYNINDDFKIYNLYNLYNSPVNLYNETNNFSTFMIKTDNFNIINNIKANSKIIFHKNDIFLQNVKVIDISSNFYSQNNLYLKSSDLSNIIFLSFGKQISGITQSDLYKHTHVFLKNRLAFDISKIVFKSNINSSLLALNYNTSLSAYVSNFYLLDFSFSNNANANNANYNNILFNYLAYKSNKVFDLNISKIIDFSNTNGVYKNNYFINSVNNLLTLNNKDPNYASISYEIFNSALVFKLKNITYDESYKLNNIELLRSELYSSNIQYNLRYNYGKDFILTSELDILLNNNITDLCSNYYPFVNSYNNLYYSKLNFYSLQVAHLFETIEGSDFENVDCIFVYHDPATETDPSFLYPYNNIEIRFNNSIDTLAKAIVLLPGERTATTNSTFIPAKNGSNLSRNMIQGLIGLNNVPKLLSIVPYDPNSIIGRGFVTQYQQSDPEPTNIDLLNKKINSIKHYSAKNNINSTNNLRATNFANVVRSNARNRLSQTCINGLIDGTINTQTVNINTPVITPFRLFG